MESTTKRGQQDSGVTGGDCGVADGAGVVASTSPTSGGMGSYRNLSERRQTAGAKGGGDKFRSWLTAALETGLAPRLAALRRTVVQEFAVSVTQTQ